MKGIMKVVKSSEESGLLIKGVTQTIENETKEQRGVFLSISLGILGASLLGNLLAGKGVIRTGHEVIRAEQDLFMPPYPLTNLEIQR